MTEREKFRIAETKEFVFARDSYQCGTCGRSIYHYGTPQMALEIKRLAEECFLRDHGILVMAGHDDGIITFGKNLAEAYAILLLHTSKS